MPPKFEKYVYWLEKEQFDDLKEKLLGDGHDLFKAKKAVCDPLSKRVEIGYVEPDAWDKFEMCRRQMSWYRESPRSGLYLVVSSFNLSEYGITPETVIRDSKFKPPELPGDDEKEEMIKQLSYQEIKPDEWDNVEGEDPAVIEKWMRVMGIRRMTYDELLLTHSANHANFIEPKYYVEDNGFGKVPYSISNKTKRICSACLEFFNIIGARHKKKMVVTCPGGAIYAGLAVNKYYEVITEAKQHVDMDE